MISIVVVASTLQQAEMAAELAGVEGRRGKDWIWLRNQYDLHGRRPTRAIIAVPDLSTKITEQVNRSDLIVQLQRICKLDNLTVEWVTT